VLAVGDSTVWFDDLVVEPAEDGHETPGRRR
jgi:hypothetical protein